ncbi:CYFA0S09e03136g1_1 [Cyberlindnera fabianii]|nr:CYFA0S09e03136g1_1 [Cyberlindnera fabianii]
MDLNVYARDDFKTEIKRRKISSEIDGREKFPPGAIMRVKVKNFVVYASTEFLLSPSLNMIIAPNGTGKSTFVCAVCLGLAGHPTLLGRQKVVSEFIKNGEQFSTIEITLKNKNEEPDVVIRREIYLNNKSDWAINDKSSSEAKVKNFLLGLNVQLDNLCQFLPQEKVADFSKLTQEELLLETQRAVDVNMMSQHKELISLDKDKEELTAQLNEKTNEQSHLEEDKLRYEEEARKYEAFQKKKDELEDHKKLLPYAELQDLKVEERRLKKERDDIKAELQRYEDEMAPFRNAVDEIGEAADKFMNASHDKRKETDQLKKDVATKVSQLEDIDTKIDDCVSKIDQLEGRAIAKRKELEKKQLQLQEDEEKLNTIEVLDDETAKQYDEQSESLFAEKAELTNTREEIQDEVSRVKRLRENAERKLNGFKNQLKSNDPILLFDRPHFRKNYLAEGSKRAVHLLRTEFRDMREEFFEPPLLTLKADNTEFAGYLESLVNPRDLVAITAISRDAFNKHSKRFIEEKNVQVPMRYLSGNTYSKKLSTQQLNELGFEGYLVDFVKGPAPVIQMLCDTVFLHDVPVSRRPLSEAQIERLSKPINGHLLFKKFFSGDVQYTLSQSEYGSRNVMSRSQNVDNKNQYFTGTGVSDDVKQQLHTQIKNQEREIEEYKTEIESLREKRNARDQEIAAIEARANEVNKFVRQNREKLKTKQKIAQRIKLHNAAIKKLNSEATADYTKDILKYKRRISYLSVQKITANCDLADAQKKYNDVAQDITLLKIQQFEHLSRKAAIKSLFGAIEEKRDHLRTRHQAAKARLQELKNSKKAKELKEKAASYTEEEKERLSVYLTQYTQEGCFSVDGIQDKIAGIEAEMSMLGSGSKSSVNTLEKINNRLAQLGQEIPELNMKIKNLSQNIVEIRDDWEPKLNNMVQKISDKFSSIFPTVGSAGEVRVERGLKFSDWKMQIMVKFRDDAPLKALDSHTQSGGERAVSTVYYMISMQELTVSPFRVVDEINQGMDARNERIVHKNMVEIACQEHTSQYFLITPKLLTNLHYADKMRIHCIMAGPWTPDPRTNTEFLTLGATSIYAS